jgi:hypothetical protein
MDNRNNPVARTIKEIQQRWIETAQSNPGYKLIRFVIRPEDAVLINGFYKLESSKYGALPEFFVVLLTPFTGRFNYSRQLLSDWISMWENDPTVKETDAQWDTAAWKAGLEEGLTEWEEENLLIEAIVDFAGRFCEENQPLVLGLVPRSVSNFSDMNDWIISVSDELPSNIKLSFIDHEGKDYLKPSFKFFKDKALSILCTDMSVHSLARQMATAGNPNDPEIGFRKCLFEMADGLNSRNRAYINEWGNKALSIALRTGKKDFIATAYLVFAGFLLQLKEEESDRLLDQGIKIAGQAWQANKEKACGPVLIQLYGFKAAYYRIKGKKREACLWLQKQARLAVNLELFIYAVNRYRAVAQMARQAGETDIYSDSLKDGYQASETLADEELRVSETAILAWYYAKELREDKQEEQAEAILSRMQRILGSGWEEKIPSFSDKYAQSVPDINETMKYYTSATH